MKKMLGMILTLVLSVVMVTGCGSDPVADDLVNYINNEMLSLFEVENTVQSEFISAFEGSSEATDLEEFAAKLKDVIIPASEELVAKSKAIVPETEEVATLHSKYVETVTEQNEALVLYLLGCQGTNELVDYATNKLIPVSELEAKMMTKYETAMGGNDATLAASLKNSIIPASNELLEKVKAIVPESEVIATVHSKYIESITEQNESFTLLLKAIEDDDIEALDTINEKLENSVKLSDEFMAGIETMSNDVTLLDSANEKLENVNKLKEEYLSDLDALKVEHNVEDEE